MVLMTHQEPGPRVRVSLMPAQAANIDDVRGGMLKLTCGEGAAQMLVERVPAPVALKLNSGTRASGGTPGRRIATALAGMLLLAIALPPPNPAWAADRRIGPSCARAGAATRVSAATATARTAPAPASRPACSHAWRTASASQRRHSRESRACAASCAASPATRTWSLPRRYLSYLAERGPADSAAAGPGPWRAQAGADASRV